MAQIDDCHSDTNNDDRINTVGNDEQQQQQQQQQHITPAQHPLWHDAVAGGVAGAGSRMLTAPLDLIRIRRQLTPRTYYPSESILQSWKTIVQNEGGVTALFRGNMAAIYLWVGYAAVQFSLYNNTKAFLLTSFDPNRQYPSAVAFVSGAVAGVFATLATYPFDVCRTTFAARGLSTIANHQNNNHHNHVTTTPHRSPVPFSSLVEPHYGGRVKPLTPSSSSSSSPSSSSNAPPRTISEFAVQLFRQKGLRGFYAGGGPAVIQIIPYMGLNFAIYDYLTRGDRRVGLSGYAGSIAGAVSKVLVYPLDTVKRRLQAQAFFVNGNSSSTSVGIQLTRTQQQQRQHYYTSMWDCMIRIAKEEGVSSFYRGMVPSVLKTTIATGLSFGFFRFSKNVLETVHETVVVM